MRLICPNCGAQYEVDPGVIPENGRDVQCSNCGHTWFQRHAQQDEREEPAVEPPAPTEPESVEPPQDTETAPAAQDTSAAEAEPAQAPAEEPAAMADGEATSGPDEGPKPEDRPKPELDDDVASILREEAARETRERIEEGSGLETQPELGLNQGAADRGTTIEERVAQMRGEEEAAIAAEETSRHDILPDIEEINSTLGAATTEAAVETPAETGKERRPGFRRGFTLALVVFAIMALVYVFAAKIADMVPGTASALASYVDWINALRTSVDNMMLRAVDKLTGLLAQLSGDNTG